MAQPIGLRIEYEPLSKDLYEVKLIGELGMGSVPSLDRVFKNIFDQNVFRLVINMEGTSYIASAGIGILVASSKTARENGGALILAGVTPRVRQVFDLVGLQQVVTFATDTKEAVKLAKKTAKS